MAEASVAAQILRRISDSDRFVVSTDFSGIGTPEAILMALSRLSKQKQLVRVRPGLYFVQRSRPPSNRYIENFDFDHLARAMARQYHSEVYMDGQIEAMRLGLSYDELAERTYLTNGLPGRVVWKRQIVRLQPAKPYLLNHIGTPAGRILQAIYWVGPTKLPSELTVMLPDSTLSELSTLVSYTARWVQRQVKHILQS